MQKTGFDPDIGGVAHQRAGRGRLAPPSPSPVVALARRRCGRRKRIKVVVARPRPPTAILVGETGNGFPSGHASGFAAFAHCPTDVLAGVLLGIGIAEAVALVDRSVTVSPPIWRFRRMQGDYS